METESLPAADKKLSKLRWYQYTLRSLLLLTLLVAIGMSHVEIMLQDGRRQKAAAEAIRKIGGGARTEQTWLGKLLQDNSVVQVTEVSCLDSFFADESLACLQGLNRLNWLNLSGAAISDEGLMHLQGLVHLDTLSLTHTKISDAGLLYLEKLHQLRVLRLSNTKITDAGLAHFQGLKKLQVLTLRGTNVTDHGIQTLRHALPDCKIDY